MTYDSQKCPSCLRPYWHCKCVQRCEECGGLTNHTTKQHREAEREQDQDREV